MGLIEQNTDEGMCPLDNPSKTLMKVFVVVVAIGVVVIDVVVVARYC